MNDRNFVSLGWWGYFSCAVIYAISGLRSGDLLGLAGSVFFLGATIAFLIPHYRSSWGKSTGKEKKQSQFYPIIGKPRKPQNVPGWPRIRFTGPKTNTRLAVLGLLLRLMESRADRSWKTRLKR